MVDRFRQVISDLKQKFPDQKWAPVPMYEFLRSVIFHGSIGPLVSSGLLTEDVVNDYAVYEKGLSLLFAGAPSLMVKDSVAARERLVKTLMTSKVCEQYSKFMRARKELIKAPPAEFARLNLGIFIASVSNSIPGVFWTVYNLLADSEAYSRCIEAIQVVVAKKSDANQAWFTLEELDQLDILQSAFLESLRMYQSFFVTRNVVEDFVLSSPKQKKGDQEFWIEKGSRLMVYPQTTHMNPNIFENPDEFRVDRFIDRETGKLVPHYYFRSFGGGAHLCPGRKFIGYETRAMIAIMLDRFQAIPNQARPGIQKMLQGFSVAHPDYDPLMQLRLLD